MAVRTAKKDLRDDIVEHVKILKRLSQLPNNKSRRVTGYGDKPFKGDPFGLLSA